jgi:hypothetical protein
MRRILSLAAVLATLGCFASTNEGARREQLLAAFPPATTTLDDVHRRLSGPPAFTRDRPDTGWSPKEHAGARALAAERRTHAAVQRVERYQLPDGVFSLQYDWFYFDADGQLVDADWEYSSD